MRMSRDARRRRGRQRQPRPRVHVAHDPGAGRDRARRSTRDARRRQGPQPGRRGRPGRRADRVRRRGRRRRGRPGCCHGQPRRRHRHRRWYGGWPAPAGRPGSRCAATGENSIVVASGANATVDEPDRRRSSARSRRRASWCTQLEIAAGHRRGGGRAAPGRPASSWCSTPRRPSRYPTSCCACVDVLVVNEHEASHLSGDGDPGRRSRRAANGVVGSRGRDPRRRRCPARATTPGRAGSPACRPPCVDTTGAGDTFTGVAGRRPRRARQSRRRGWLAPWSRASLAVETPGAVPSIPTAAQIDRRAGR